MRACLLGDSASSDILLWLELVGGPELTARIAEASRLGGKAFGFRILLLLLVLLVGRRFLGQSFLPPRVFHLLEGCVVRSGPCITDRVPHGQCGIGGGVCCRDQL